MENEIMNYEEEILDTTVETEEKSGMSTGVAMLIGAGLAFAGTAIVKLVKKGIDAVKAKKELRKPDGDVLVDDEDLVEVTNK